MEMKGYGSCSENRIPAQRKKTCLLCEQARVYVSLYSIKEGKQCYKTSNFTELFSLLRAIQWGKIIEI